MKDNFTTTYTIGMFVFLIATVLIFGVVFVDREYNSQVNKCYETFKTLPTNELHKLCGVLK